MRSDLWQGYCGYWQNSFIRENPLPLGHMAWKGFTTQGRGMVVCNVAITKWHRKAVIIEEIFLFTRCNLMLVY